MNADWVNPKNLNMLQIKINGESILAYLIFDMFLTFKTFKFILIWFFAFLDSQRKLTNESWHIHSLTCVREKEWHNIHCVFFIHRSSKEGTWFIYAWCLSVLIIPNAEINF